MFTAQLEDLFLLRVLDLFIFLKNKTNKNKNKFKQMVENYEAPLTWTRGAKTR